MNFCPFEISKTLNNNAIRLLQYIKHYNLKIENKSLDELSW